MNLAEALAATETRKGPLCTVCQLLENPPADTTREQIEAALAGDLTQAHLARAFAVLTGEPRWTGRGGTIGTHRSARHGS